MTPKINVNLKLRLVISVMAICFPVIFLTVMAISALSASQAERSARQSLAATATSGANQVERWDHYFVLALANVRGQPDILSMRPADQLPVLEQMQKTYDRLEIVRVTSPDGWSRARTDGSTPVDYSDRTWFKECMTGSPVARQTLITKTSGKPALNVSTPITDSKGKVIGVLSAVTGLASMSDVLNLANEGNNCQMLVVDGQGRELAGPGLEGAKELQDMSHDERIAGALRGQFGDSQYTDGHGEVWLVHATRLSNGWILISQTPRDVVMAPSRSIIRTAYLLGGMALLILAGLANLLAARLVRPIHELTRGAHDLAQGNWERRVPEGRNDEIGRLSRSFNQMAGQLDRKSVV